MRHGNLTRTLAAALGFALAILNTMPPMSGGPVGNVTFTRGQSEISD